jgi:protein SCO1/2
MKTPKQVRRCPSAARWRTAFNRRRGWLGFLVRGSVLGIVGVVAAISLADSADARKEKTPEPLEEVGVTEKLDAQVPLDLRFVDTAGEPVKLGDYFDGTRPVLLTMNYSDCPMLCSLQLNGLFEGLGRMRWNIGEEFEMITVSIDPLETPQRARLTKQKYLKMYGRPGVAGGWHCVVGEEDNIRKLADTVGFGYNYDPVSKQYGHAAVTMVLTPEGRVSRYLYGVEYDPQTLRLSLLEASEGEIGSTTDQILLYCFQYDAEAGRYAPAAFRIMQVGGVLTVVALGGVLAVFWRREARAGKDSNASN